MGGKPSKGTSSDQRLKANRGKPTPTASRGGAAFGGKKATPFGKSSSKAK